MVALLEATMWRQIRDPDFMLGALKTYRMMTGLSQMDPAVVTELVDERSCRTVTPAPPFPTDAAKRQQMAAIDRMPVDKSFIAADPALVQAAVKTVCTISLPRRAYPSWSPRRRRRTRPTGSR